MTNVTKQTVAEEDRQKKQQRAHLQQSRERDMINQNSIKVQLLSSAAVISGKLLMLYQCYIY